MRVLIILLMLLSLMPRPVHACPEIGDPIQDIKGNVLVGASVYIYLANTSTLAQLYSDAACTLVLSQPVTTNSKGTFSVYVADGVYDIQPIKSGYSFDRIQDVTLEDRFTILSPTYSTSITLNRAGAQRHIITATNNTNFTINAPSGTVSAGSPLWVVIRNNSGTSLGTITWDSVFKKASFTAPGNGAQRSALFYWNGTNWVEDVKTPADVTY